MPDGRFRESIRRLPSQLLPGTAAYSFSKRAVHKESCFLLVFVHGIIFAFKLIYQLCSGRKWLTPEEVRRYKRLLDFERLEWPPQSRGKLFLATAPLKWVDLRRGPRPALGKYLFQWAERAQSKILVWVLNLLTTSFGFKLEASVRREWPSVTSWLIRSHE